MIQIIEGNEIEKRMAEELQATYDTMTRLDRFSSTYRDAQHQWSYTIVFANMVLDSGKCFRIHNGKVTLFEYKED